MAEADKGDAHILILADQPASSSSSTTQLNEVAPERHCDVMDTSSSPAITPTKCGGAKSPIYISADDDVSVISNTELIASTFHQLSDPPSLLGAASSSSRPMPAQASYASATSGVLTPPVSSAMPFPESYVTVVGSTATIDIPEDSRAGHLFSSTMERGVYFDALPDTKLWQYSRALKTILPKDAIDFIARKPRSVLVYFKDKAHADQVLTEGLTINDVHLLAQPVAHRPVQVTFYPVPPEVSDAALCTLLSRYGRVVGSITTLSAAPRDPEDKSIRGFRRTARVLFSSDAQLKAVPNVLHIRCGQQRRRVEIITSQYCTICQSESHIRAQCPRASLQTAPHTTSSSTLSTNASQTSSYSRKVAESRSSKSQLTAIGQQTTLMPPPPADPKNFPRLPKSTPPSTFTTTADVHVDHSSAFTVGSMTRVTGNASGSDSPDDHEALVVAGKRSGATRPKTKKSKTLASRRSSRSSTRSSTRSVSSRRPFSRSPLHTSSETACEGAFPSLEEFTTFLAENAFPAEPLPYEDVLDCLLGSSSPSSARTSIQQYEAALPQVLVQLHSLENTLRRTADEVPWSACFLRRLHSITTASQFLLHPTTNLDIQGGVT